MEKKIEKLLKEIVEKLKVEYEPIKIILYGSYAHGNPNENSDIDLLILKDTNEKRVERFVQVKKIIYSPERKIPISPLIYSPTELNERLKIEDDFIKEILNTGIILYEESSS
ncbi:MAG: nucleotidyltransferase domain-containing protein [Candidatus Odinarchaeota archaeon]